MSNIDFLTADVAKLLLNGQVTFSQGGAADLPKISISLRDYYCKLGFFELKQIKAL